MLSPQEAEDLIARDARNREVLFPYLIGDDQQSSPDQSASRWVINFGEKTEEMVRSYVEPFRLLERRVGLRAESDNSGGGGRQRRAWWRYTRDRPALRSALEEHPLAFARTRVSDVHAFCRLPRGVVPAARLIVMVADGWGEFEVVQSALHEVWVLGRPALHETRITYVGTDHFETFPFPEPLPQGDTGRLFHECRAESTLRRGEGLTELARRINDPAQCDDDIVRLRTLMTQLDQEVAAAYEWADVDLDHGFHDTPIGRRFTICEDAREEIVDRLLELNHARYAEEVQQGLHTKGARRTSRRRPAAPSQPSLLGDGEE